jgi:VanZ family protein
VLVVLLSLYVLFWPDTPGPSGPPGADKVVHATLFALLAATARWRWGTAPAVLVAVLAYAGVSELVQWVLLPHRSGDVRDLVADSAGATLGWLLARHLNERARR